MRLNPDIEVNAIGVDKDGDVVCTVCGRYRSLSNVLAALREKKRVVSKIMYMDVFCKSTDEYHVYKVFKNTFRKYSEIVLE